MISPEDLRILRPENISAALILPEFFTTSQKNPEVKRRNEKNTCQKKRFIVYRMEKQ